MGAPTAVDPLATAVALQAAESRRLAHRRAADAAVQRLQALADEADEQVATLQRLALLGPAALALLVGAAWGGAAAGRRRVHSAPSAYPGPARWTCPPSCARCPRPSCTSISRAR